MGKVDKQTGSGIGYPRKCEQYGMLERNKCNVPRRGEREQDAQVLDLGKAALGSHFLVGSSLPVEYLLWHDAID